VPSTPCQNGGMGAEAQLLVQILSYSCFQVNKMSNHTHWIKKGGVKFCLKGMGLFAGQKSAFWKPWRRAVLPPAECKQVFSMLPRDALLSVMVWNAGVGRCWAATTQIFKGCAQLLI
jgi:hypothetical protein